MLGWMSIPQITPTNYTLCCYSIENDTIFATVNVHPDHMNIVKYLERIARNIGRDD